MKPILKVYIFIAAVISTIILLAYSLSQITYVTMGSYFSFRIDRQGYSLTLSSEGIYHGEELVIEEGSITFLGNLYPFSLLRDGRYLNIEFWFNEMKDFEVQSGFEDERTSIIIQNLPVSDVYFHGRRSNDCFVIPIEPAFIGTTVDEEAYVFPVSWLHEWIIISAITVHARTQEVYTILSVYFIFLPIALALGLILFLQPNLKTIFQRLVLNSNPEKMRKVRTLGFIITFLSILSPLFLLIL